MNTNKDIYLYSDYRSLLKDYFQSRKKAVPSFTYQCFAEQAGFASPSFGKLVMTGQRNLGSESIPKICRALKLNRKASSYFENLVRFNQAANLDDKLLYLKRLDSLRRRNRPEKVHPSHYRYFSKWYHCVIREMVEFPGFQEEPEWIAQRLHGKVSAAEVSGSLTLLIETGFLRRGADGRLVKQDKTLMTGEAIEDESLALMIRQFHLQMIDLAREFVANRPRHERSVSNTTLCMSDRSYAAAQKRIEQMRMELLEIAQSQTDADKVYQLTISVFPVAEDKA